MRRHVGSKSRRQRSCQDWPGAAVKREIALSYCLLRAAEDPSAIKAPAFPPTRTLDPSGRRIVTSREEEVLESRDKVEKSGPGDSADRFERERQRANTRNYPDNEPGVHKLRRQLLWQIRFQLANVFATRSKPERRSARSISQCQRWPVQARQDRQSANRRAQLR
jgi:hypothetical protein